MIGAKLQTAFRKNSKGARGEIALFRAFISAFDALGGEALAKEYHGSRYQVTFDEGRGAGRPVPRCELCDVMIVSYPKGNPWAARVTFNQAKVAGSPFDCGWSPTSHGPYRFRANLEQWDLLSNRPSINPATATFSPPAGLLKDALLPSVGSFGVFYPSAGGFEFAYFVANALTPLNNSPSRSGTLEWDTPIRKVRRVGSHDEVLGTCCLQYFGDGIEEGHIGTPLTQLLNGTPGGQQSRVWITQILVSLQSEYPESTLPSELLEGFELRAGLDDENRALVGGGYSSPRAVVLIRT